MKNRVKEFRKQLKLTQDELAQELGVTRQTINAIENNKYNPTLELALKMSRFLSVPVELLFTLDQPSNSIISAVAFALYYKVKLYITGFLPL